ncbi:hypothetical protein BZG02_13535 [Labilibaculum filiforme]|uniref:Uncharacterized protein n=1 Tax=Labilibaculum filiforme TaxID=1940526 RepID=A0A2N3HW81_9BACT|nr:sigma-70 family RNA polymerase sigma factor [Labilibaculum filiforme]PKQ62326.1 hypothetical protein BZG02_13535 [Labilibaculum filiforme]
MSETLEGLVVKANSGDKKALEKILVEIQDLVYNLSIKMLLFREDANDATQEILIKIVTHLSTFNHQSQFKTWVYRIATNYLLTQKGKKSKEYSVSFDEYANQIDAGLSDNVNYTQNEGEIALLEKEVMFGCTQGLLLCLNEEDRMIYIMSVVLEFNSTEASKILDITPENFRKKLSRSKTKIKNFMSNKCGLVNKNNPCRCKRKIDFLIDNKIMNPNNLMEEKYYHRTIDFTDKIGDLQKTMAIYQTAPKMPAPDTILKEMKKALRLN